MLHGTGSSSVAAWARRDVAVLAAATEPPSLRASDDFMAATSDFKRRNSSSTAANLACTDATSVVTLASSEATEEATVEFSTNAPTLVDAQGNELDWRMEGCPSPATRAAEAQEAATALRQEMSERGLDAAQQMAVAERLREFVQKLTGDASKLATNGEVDAQHVLQAAEAFVRESKGGHGELEAFVASRSGREGDDEK
jgi:hypothetical protein